MTFKNSRLDRHRIHQNAKHLRSMNKTLMSVNCLIHANVKDRADGPGQGLSH